MHVQHVLAALALTSAVTAAPLADQKRAATISGAKQFSVAQSPPKSPGKKIAGPIALAQALGKYSKLGLKPSAAVKAAAAKAAATDDGTVSANPEQYDQAYLEPVSIGGQTLNLDFDTGSSDL